MSTPRTMRNRFIPSFDALERRDVMSVTSATVVGGTLRVYCDAANDNVEIRDYFPVLQDVTLASARGTGLASPVRAAAMTPAIAAVSPSAVTFVGPLPGYLLGSVTVKDLTRTINNTWTFARSGVQRIEVDLDAGNDKLDSKSTLPTEVYAGHGDDRVETGAGNDRVIGDRGNDTIFTNDGHDSVWAGPGDDTVAGGNGNDGLAGNDGSDLILGGDGNDSLFGGNEDITDHYLTTADDMSFGNLIYGEAGNDSLFGINRSDVVDGGAGYDALKLKAGTWIARNGEDVKIGVPQDQPQDDNWSCGPNSGSRLLRAYGIDVSYAALRSGMQENSLLSRYRLGTLPSTLRDKLREFKSDIGLETESSLQRVLDLLASGKPVIALVAVAKVGFTGGSYGLLHYVVLNGFDQATQTIRYVDTNGAQKTWTFAEFDFHWKWFEHFTGLGETLQAFLEGLGLRKRTILF